MPVSLPSGHGQLLRALWFLVPVLAAFSTASAAQEPLPLLKARRISLCESPPACEHVGGIRVLGMLELPPLDVAGHKLSQLSDLAWDDDDGVLYAVSDRGTLYGLRPAFDQDRLTGVSLISAAPLIDPKTRKPVRFRRSDSEGLDILNGRNGRKGDAELLVSFEGEPRLARHRPDGSIIAEVPLSAPLNDIGQYRYNRMLEGVCVHPREGILTAPEEPLLIDNGVARLYRQDGRSWPLPTPRGGIVALECLPNGDVLVLERDFTTIVLRFVITLRRVHLPENAAADTTLKSEVIAVLDSADGLTVDNFEGLTRHRGNRFFMISDNNDVFLQRTLLMYFELLP
ncbi:MAG TPA: hypothetical protein DIC36_03600 [Gammaproteobacteria bacterium]|nr:hypothetical protein [Gammaproteobacteria bacterium]